MAKKQASSLRYSGLKTPSKQKVYADIDDLLLDPGTDEIAKPNPTPAKASAVSNMIDDLYFGTAEKTVSESSYNAESMSRPYNPDDLFQKTNDYSIYEDMMKDDQVSVCMTIKKDLVIGSGWDIITGEDSDLHNAIKEDLENSLGEDPATPFDDQLEEIVTAYEFGFSLSEKIFQNRPDGSLTLKNIKTRHPSTWLIHTDKKGNIEKFEQRGTDSSFPVEPKSLIHYVNHRRFQNPYGRSDLRTAYNAWFIKRQIVRYYGIFLEKAASPVPVAKYPSNISREAVDDIYAAIKKFQTKTALCIPKEIEVDFLEAKNSGEVFIKGINIFNMFIGRSMVIPDLLGFQGGETTGGAYSLGKTQLEALFKHIGRRRTSLERVINKEIIQPLVVYNYGFVDHFPKFKLKPVSDEHAIELAKLWISVVNGKTYVPNEEEINHFRKLANFPEGSVTLISQQSGMNPEGTPLDQQQNKDTQNGSSKSKDDQEKENQKEDSQQNQGLQDEVKNITQSAEGSSEEHRDSHAGLDKPVIQPEGEVRQFKIYDFPSGSYHKKVDFSALESQMNRFKSRITSEALPIVKRIYEDLFEQMDQKKIIKDVKPERIEDIKIKYLKELKLVFKRNLREAHQDGKLSGQKELLKGNYRTPLADDKFLEILESELFQYVGDWSYNLSKNARIAMMAAIRDGKPLSSVIDTLDQDGMVESVASIERFARTKITDVMNRGRLEFFNESGVVAAYQYSAVLDDRTTEICRGLHGKIFKSGSEPVPPMHFNCRSLLIPITKYEDFTVSESVGKTAIDQFIEENKGDGFSTK